jgi:hypothetical protein
MIEQLPEDSPEEIKEAKVLLWNDKVFEEYELSIESGVLVIINSKTDEMNTFTLENTDEYSVSRSNRSDLVTLLIKVPRKVIEISHKDVTVLDNV